MAKVNHFEKTHNFRNDTTMQAQQHFVNVQLQLQMIYSMLICILVHLKTYRSLFHNLILHALTVIFIFVVSLVCKLSQWGVGVPQYGLSQPESHTSVSSCTVGFLFPWLCSSRLFRSEMHESMYSMVAEVQWPAGQQMYLVC